MTRQFMPCRWEALVIRAAQDDADAGAGAGADAALTAHLDTCASCQELFDVAGSMTHLARATEIEATTRTLPAPGQIWWKAQLIKRWEAEARATAPVDMMQRAEVIGGLLAGLALVLTLWPDMQRLEGSGGAQQWLPLIGWPALARMLEPSTFTPLIVGGALLLCAATFLTFRQLFAED
jgi:hypothetical protein